MIKPTKVKVGGLEYRIWFEREFGDNLFGRTVCSDQEILINKDVSEERQRVTLLHELIHAISNEMLEKQIDEQQVNALSQELYRILNEDKKIRSLLLPNLSD